MNGIKGLEEIIMKITNSMTGQKEEFVPIEKDKVRMYACGITVYDLSHIGHARQAIVYAMMADYFRFKGYDVTYVRNYTDVDDKIIKRANERGVDALEFSKMQIEENEKDMENLHITDADIKPKASEYISKIIDFIEGLIERGFAYCASNGDVYFSVRKFEEYGKLSHRNIDELLEGVRIEVEEEKKEPADFALWKSAKPDEISWNSPWGKGRPGWHIECSCMALDTLGETIDIHGGGRDLLFPHHENEVAQSEALTGKKFANYWTHCGLIKINGEKMSKSLGNSLTIREILEEYNYEVVKFVMFSKHYTSDIDISEKDFKEAEAHLYYFYNTINRVQKYIELNQNEESEEVIHNEITDSIVSKFIDAMEDDFNTVSAISNLYILFKYMNNLMDSSKEDSRIIANTLTKMLTDIKDVYCVLGLFEQNQSEFIEGLQDKFLDRLDIDRKWIEVKVNERIEAKKEKDFERADMIREELDAKGIILKDSGNMTTWDVRELYFNN